MNGFILKLDFRNWVKSFNLIIVKGLPIMKRNRRNFIKVASFTGLGIVGGTDGRQLYRQAWLMQAEQQIQSKNYNSALTSISTARLWPENLGVGKPYEDDIDSRLENYMEGICYEKTKRPDQALKKWNEIISLKMNVYNTNTLVTALTLKKVSRHDEGEKLLSEWLIKEPDSKVARWCNEVYHGQIPTAEFEG